YDRVEDVGAEATAAHATLHPLTVSMHPAFGELAKQSMGLAATLAESTGRSGVGRAWVVNPVSASGR
ncbi:MAG TPA: hypothetical protein VF163_12905, partial [Micromonosporaceae bacterium]